MNKPTFRQLIQRYGQGRRAEGIALGEKHYGVNGWAEKQKKADEHEEALFTALRKAGVPIDGTVP